jgi:hypothetical protein
VTTLRLAVVVPYRNENVRIIRCIASIADWINPSCAPHVVIIDDGSQHRKGAQASIAPISFNLPITCLTLQTQHGPGHARNLGIEWAASRSFSHIMFVDADDYLTGPVTSEDMQTRFFRIFNSVEVEDSAGVERPTAPAVIKTNRAEPGSSIQTELARFLHSPNRSGTLTFCWAKIFNTSFLMKCQLRFPEHISTFEDVRFILEAVSLGRKVDFSFREIYAHTNRPGFSTATLGSMQGLNQLFGFLDCIRFLRARRQRFGISNTDVAHLAACYYSIQMTRAAAMCLHAGNVDLMHETLNRRIRSRFFRRAMEAYSPALAMTDGAVKAAIMSIGSNMEAARVVFTRKAQERYGVPTT